MTNIDVTVTAQSDTCHIVAIGSMPIASCGSAERAGIVRAALAMLAEHHGEELRDALGSLPRTVVPGAEPVIHVTREVGAKLFEVSSPDSCGDVTAPLGRAADHVVQRVRELGGRAVVVYRDEESLTARAAREAQATVVDQLSPATGGVWSQVMASDTARLVDDIDDLTGGGR
jgi:hypothetical protein